MIGREPVSIPWPLQPLEREGEDIRRRGGRCAFTIAPDSAAVEPLAAKVSESLAVRSGER